MLSHETTVNGPAPRGPAAPQGLGEVTEGGDGCAGTGPVGLQPRVVEVDRARGRVVVVPALGDREGDDARAGVGEGAQDGLGPVGPSAGCRRSTRRCGPAWCRPRRAAGRCRAGPGGPGRGPGARRAAAGCTPTRPNSCAAGSEARRLSRYTAWWRGGSCPGPMCTMPGCTAVRSYPGSTVPRVAEDTVAARSCINDPSTGAGTGTSGVGAAGSGGGGARARAGRRGGGLGVCQTRPRPAHDGGRRASRPDRAEQPAARAVQGPVVTGRPLPAPFREQNPVTSTRPITSRTVVRTRAAPRRALRVPDQARPVRGSVIRSISGCGRTSATRPIAAVPARSTAPAARSDPAGTADRGGELGGVGDRDHVRAAGRVAARPHGATAAQGGGPVGGRDPIMATAHDEHRAPHDPQRAVDAVAPRRVHGPRHPRRPRPPVVAHQQRDLVGALPPGGAQPAADQAGPAVRPRVRGGPDQHQTRHPARCPRPRPPRRSGSWPSARPARPAPRRGRRAARAGGRRGRRGRALRRPHPGAP
jgi:hypothetical protein